MGIVKNSIISTSFGFLTQFLSFIVMPILIQNVGDFEFGRYSSLISLVFIAIPLTSFRIEFTFFDESKKGDKDIVSTLYVLIFITSLFLSFCHLFFVRSVEDAIKFFTLLLTMSIFLVNSQYFIYKNQFLLVGFLRFFEISLFFLLGFLIELIYSRTISLFMVSILPIFLLFKNGDIDIRKIIKENIDFIRYLTPGHLLNGFCRELPTLLIGAKFGLEVGGYFFLMTRLFRVPVTILANGLGDVIRRDFQGSIFQYNFKKAIFFSLILSFTGFTILGILSEYILEDLFRLDYSKYHAFVIPLAISSSFQTVSNIYGNIYIVLGMQKTDFFWQLSSFIFLILWVIYIQYTSDIVVVANSICLCWSISHVLNIILITKCHENSDYNRLSQ